MYTTPEHPDPAPMVASNQYFERPEQVQLCYRACCEGDLDSVKEQVRQLLHNPEAAPVGQEPSPKWLYSSLCEAILRNDVSIVKFMLDEGVAGKRLPGEEAVRSQAYEVLELLLLQYGWDINESMGRNRTSVLGIPVSTGDREMVTWLLDHGADPNSRGEWDLTPTSHAMLGAPLDIIHQLFQRGADPCCGQLLHYAVLRDKPDALEVVRLLVEKGAPINEVKYEKFPKTYYEREPFGLGTALHRAAEVGKPDVVRYLLEQGADPLRLDSKKRTARFWAEKKGHMEEAKLLQEAEQRCLSTWKL